MKKNMVFIMSLLVSAIAFPMNDAKREVALFQAVEAKDFQMVKLIVKQGVSLNSLNKDGKTVLDIAAQRNYGKICRYLIRSGAKVTSVESARMLEKNLYRRGVLMAVFGVLSGVSGILGLGLIIGGILSLNDKLMVSIL